MNLVDKLRENLQGKPSPKSWYSALVKTINSELSERANYSENAILNGKNKFANYMSMEYLLGKLGKQTLINIELEKSLEKFFKKQNTTLEKVLSYDVSTQLGNGGLGRLAACFFDSIATHNLPVFGYGLFYRCGIYKQEIVKGEQIELPDFWQSENMLGIRKPNISYPVFFGGKIVKNNWIPKEIIRCSANDILLAGFNTLNVAKVRLWEAARKDNSSPAVFKTIKNITDFLYPPDNTNEGKRLRLRQEQVLTSASVQDIFARFHRLNLPISKLADFVSVQLNDTHPTLAIPEFIRILMSEHNYDFDAAYHATEKICNYTNHTLMAEAMEKISLDLLRSELPQHLKIIEKIDSHFNTVASVIIPESKLQNVAIIDHKTKVINSGNLCMSATAKTNGVARLHSDLIRKKEFKTMANIFPKKFTNITNGISFRKWSLEANPALANLVTDLIGNRWIVEPQHLRDLLKYKNDSGVLDKLSHIKTKNKVELFDTLKLRSNPELMLDSQTKRIHEYKRQFLNILQIIHRYNLIKQGHNITPKVALFSGKAPPTYEVAKDIVSLIHNVAKLVNNDKKCNGILEVVFVPNYNVDIAGTIIRATNLSEQISTAGKEASGTGNMKYALNGALTIGTLDGANVEIANAVGKKNIFIFGLNSDQVYKEKNHGYNPKKYIKKQPSLAYILNQIEHGFFGEHEALLEAFFDDQDQYMIAADFASYINAQHAADKAFANKKSWAKKSLVNIANCGYFSSDRSISEYAKNIWNIEDIKE